MRAASILCVGLVLSGCVKKEAASSTNADASSSRIAGTIHGSPVNSNNVVLTNVTEDQLVAYLGGASGNVGGDQGTVLALQGGGDTPYMKQCRDAGVPIPPAWGDAKWEFKGTLPNDRIFALDASLRTELHIYDDPNGVCAALPRKDQGEIFALGIICQGKNGKACFWDNVDVQTQQKIKDPAKIRPELISDATNLRENCSGCHRGDNVFIIHAGTVLDQLTNTDLDKDGKENRGVKGAYQPIGPADWNNPAGVAALAPNCQSCHALPALSGAYCSILTQSVLGSVGAGGVRGTPTMPPAGEDRADFEDDINALLDACEKVYDAEAAAEAAKNGSPTPIDFGVDDNDVDDNADTLAP
jgi:hypothetical protein